MPFGKGIFAEEKMARALRAKKEVKEMSVQTRNRIAKYLDHEIEIEPSATPEEVQSNLAEVFPEVAHAEITEDKEGNLCFTVVAGTKG